MPEEIDPAMWDEPQMRPVFTTHDIGALFRALNQAGLSQYRIAKLIGRSQSRVCEIAHGQPVIVYEVLKGIAEGLGIPPERMGFCPGGDRTVSGTAPGAPTMGRHHSRWPRKLMTTCSDVMCLHGVLSSWSECPCWVSS
ncbi:MAG: helix-turn-helix domain-containing protein [Pseudonocardiaceae bacterium]